MRTISTIGLRAAAATFAMGTALALAGCNRSDQTTQDTAANSALPALPATLPLTTGEATAVTPAPAASALPDAKPIALVRPADPGADYAYADAAYGFSDALGDAPPDYGFGYDGVDPWAWQSEDDSLAFAEPIDDGYRYYYYRPGAREPYFVRDPDYAYGYDDGRLAAVYGPNGAILPYADYGPRLVYASRYLVRGRALYTASRGHRRPVVAANWVARSPVIEESRRAWRQDRGRQPEWIRYHQTQDDRERSHWADEARRRQADVRRFDDWRSQEFQSPPPPRAIPAAWQHSDWARDDRRYAPVSAAPGPDRHDGPGDARHAGRPDGPDPATREPGPALRPDAVRQPRGPGGSAGAAPGPGRDRPGNDGRRDRPDQHDAGPAPGAPAAPSHREARRTGPAGDRPKQEADRRQPRPMPADRASAPTGPGQNHRDRAAPARPDHAGPAAPDRAGGGASAQQAVSHAGPARQRIVMRDHRKPARRAEPLVMTGPAVPRPAPPVATTTGRRRAIPDPAG